MNNKVTREKVAEMFTHLFEGGQLYLGVHGMNIEGRFNSLVDFYTKWLNDENPYDFTDEDMML